MSELFKSKNINVVPYQDGYTVMSLTDQVSPGVYVKVNVEQNTWYDIEAYCERRIGPPPGIWIASLDNRTIFFGEFVQKKQYIQKSIFIKNNEQLLVGLLFQGNTRHNSTFFFKHFTVTKREVQPQGVPFNQNPYTQQIQHLQQQLQQLQTKAISHEQLQQQQKPILLQLSKSSPEQPKQIEAPHSTALIPTQPFQSSIDILRNILNGSTEEEEQDTAVPGIYEIQYSKNGLEITTNVIVSEDLEGNEIYPIFFGIPEELVSSRLPEKQRDFAISYVGIDEPLSSTSCVEADYWKNLEVSRFLFVPYGKERVSVLEALAKGCIPYLSSVSTNQFLPNSILEKVKKLDGIYPGYVDKKVFSEETYRSYAEFFLGYTRSFLTTKAVARYMLQAMKKPHAKKVLFLTMAYAKEEVELQASLVHGMKSLLGEDNVIDFPKFSPVYKTKNDLEGERSKLPKHGYSYWFRLQDSDKTVRGNLEKRIEEKEFDLVLVMGVFTEEIRKQLRLKKGEFPYSKQVVLSYEPDEIAFIDGHDDPSKTEEARKSLVGKGLFFRW